jgi:hypothetical protein
VWPATTRDGRTSVTVALHSRPGDESAATRQIQDVTSLVDRALCSARPSPTSTWRKRHLLTDTLGLLAVLVTPASTTDRDAARLLRPAAWGRFGRLARVWADGGYTGHLIGWSATQRFHAA